jgi:hypothetical protein
MPGDKNVVIQSLFTAALETISLLNVARISNLISDMNHALLVKEIDNIVSLLSDRLVQNAENAGYVLSEAFFKTPSLFASGLRTEVGSRSQNDKGQKGPERESRRGSDGFKGHEDMLEKKNQRQENIVGLLKGQSNLTIKDFSRVIKDCSEKTIQRELLELVARGVIKKEGERRWSRYSLK